MKLKNFRNPPLENYFQQIQVREWSSLKGLREAYEGVDHPCAIRVYALLDDVYKFYLGTDHSMLDVRSMTMTDNDLCKKLDFIAEALQLSMDYQKHSASVLERQILKDALNFSTTLIKNRLDELRLENDRIYYLFSTQSSNKLKRLLEINH